MIPETLEPLLRPKAGLSGAGGRSDAECYQVGTSGRCGHQPRLEGAEEDEHLGQIQGAFLELGSVFCLKQSRTQERPARAPDGPPVLVIFCFIGLSLGS